MSRALWCVIANDNRPKGDDRPPEQIARVQVANTRTNADRPKGDDRPQEQIASVRIRNSKTNRINNPKNNPKRPGKKLHKYDESSIHPPTLNQFHDSGCFPANAKAAACALQPPDPSRTMVFMNELIQEIRVQPILTFLSQKFWASASSLDDDSYLKLQSQTMDMLGSLKLFLTYESLDDDFEEYDCESPLPYEELTRKTVQETASKVRKEWLIELQQYVGYVERYSSTRGSNEQNKAESLDKVISEWKETLRLTTFSGFNDVKRFYRMYEEY